jgi:hypothetical protein
LFETAESDGSEIIGNWHSHGRYFAVGNNFSGERLVVSPSDQDFANWRMRYESNGWSVFYHLAEDGVLKKFIASSSNGQTKFVSEAIYRIWIANNDGSGFLLVIYDLRKLKKKKRLNKWW